MGKARRMMTKVLKAGAKRAEKRAGRAMEGKVTGKAEKVEKRNRTKNIHRSTPSVNDAR